MRSHLALAKLAEAQHGVVTFRQLRELGFSKGHISRASESDRLRRVHRGIYGVGHRELSTHGRCMAAVLACGPGAVLSHLAAAWLWGLFPTCPSEIDVTVPGKHRRRAIRVHRVAAIADRDCAVRERIPVTTVSRLLLDLAASRSRRDLDRAVDRAKRRGLLDLNEVDRLLARRARVAGARQLREALSLYRREVADRARSELLFLDAIEREGLPPPAINTFVAGYELDAYWPSHRFAVEVDGWESHGGRLAFEEDRLRQEELMLADIASVRITARRIEKEPQQVARRLRDLLTKRAPHL